MRTARLPGDFHQTHHLASEVIDRILSPRGERLTRFRGKAGCPQNLSDIPCEWNRLLIDDLSSAQIFPLHLDPDRQFQLARVVCRVLVRDSFVDADDTSSQAGVSPRLLGQAIRSSKLNLLLNRLGQLEVIPAAKVRTRKRRDVNRSNVARVRRPDRIPAPAAANQTDCPNAESKNRRPA